MQISHENKELLIDIEIAASRAYTRGIQTGSGGNFSTRLPNSDHMLVKSSGGSFADCDRTGKGIVLTDFFGEMINPSEGKPTREVFLHGLLYQLKSDLGAVMHCHSPWSIVWSFREKALPMITYHSQLKFNCEIPVLNIPSPFVRPEDAGMIKALFENNTKLPAFILVGHGVVSLGDDILKAEHTAELVEETAQIAVLSNLMEFNV